MLVNVYSYSVMEKSVPCCCVYGRRVILNPVTYVDVLPQKLVHLQHTIIVDAFMYMAKLLR